jgi:hypothetical protein
MALVRLHLKAIAASKVPIAVSQELRAAKMAQPLQLPMAIVARRELIAASQALPAARNRSRQHVN